MAVIKKHSKIKELKLISKKRIIHNKNSRKNKNRELYKWTLERVLSTNDSNGIEIDYFPSSSENGLIQTLKTEIIAKLNSDNIFDFDYNPSEKDYIKITSKKNKNEYLNLIFFKWKMDRGRIFK